MQLRQLINKTSTQNRFIFYSQITHQPKTGSGATHQNFINSQTRTPNIRESTTKFCIKAGERACPTSVQILPLIREHFIVSKGHSTHYQAVPSHHGGLSSTLYISFIYLQFKKPKVLAISYLPESYK